jgi:CTP:molybdopterin cytidylyltransferase MocA
MNTTPSIIALVTAGHSHKEDDPLADYTQGGPKALIPIAGKPMIAHVVDAVAGSRYVEHLAVVDLDPDLDVTFSVPVEHVPGTGDLLGNVEAGLRYAVDRYPDLDGVVLSTSDVPTITAEVIDTFIKMCFETDHTLYYPIVERSVMETRFPKSSRTYVHLREGDFAGGDVFLFRPGLSVGNRELWDSLAQSRKSALRQVRMFGIWPLLKLIARRLSLAEAERRACDVLQIRGHAVVFPYPEVGMDVDKPFQLEIARAELKQRAVRHA